MEVKKILGALSRIGTAIAGIRVTVEDMPPEKGVGMSLREKAAKIWLALGYPFPDLSEDESLVVLYGVYAHELLHILLTDFAYEHTAMEQFPPRERALRHEIANVIEDPAIENFRSEYLPEFYSNALKKSIGYFYRNSSLIEDADTAYGQFLTALIQYGDVGVLKGNFTFPEAYEAFCKAMPLVNEAIEEISSPKRFQLSMQVYDIAEPLIPSLRFPALAAKKILRDAGKMSSDGTEEPLSMPGEAEGLESGEGRADEPDNTKRRRHETQKQLEQGKKNGSQGDDISSALAKCLSDMQDDGEYQITKEDMEALHAALQSAMYDDAGARHNTKDTFSVDDLEFRVESPYYKDAKVSFEQKPPASEADKAGYSILLNEVRREYINLRSSLKKIFHDEFRHKEYKMSGHLDVQRFCGRKMTARVFNRNTLPDNRADLSIVILVDESGSMSGSLWTVKKTLVLLLEAFSDFNIPIKVIGFTSKDGFDAKYFHYGSWVSTGESRARISSMEARGGTFLGHAIRYAGGLLKKRPEAHKIFLVITDGDPEHRIYRTKSDGMYDCRYAVADIRKFAHVIGVGLYENEREKKNFEFVFGKDCTTMSDISVLVKELPRRVKKLIQN